EEAVRRVAAVLVHRADHEEPEIVAHRVSFPVCVTNPENRARVAAVACRARAVRGSPVVKRAGTGSTAKIWLPDGQSRLPSTLRGRVATMCTPQTQRAGSRPGA